MTVILATRGDITLEAVERVAWRGEHLRIAPEAIRTIDSRRRSFMKLLDSDESIVVYGVTSGYGGQADQRLTSEERKRHARRAPYAAAVTFGEPLPPRVARAIVLARLANYIEGHAAARSVLTEAIAGMLDRESLPSIPGLGNGGAGEHLALSHLFAELGQMIGLEEKEALSLISGCPCSAALIADAALAARRRISLACEVFALAAEAFRAPLDAYAPELGELWGDDSETLALTRLRGLLEGAASERRAYQAPVSFRILPRMLGRAVRAQRAAESAAAVSLRAVTDNPVYIAPTEGFPLGRVISNGGFHSGLIYPALDDLAASWADLCLLAERQGAKLLDGRVSQLPHMLLTRTEDDRHIGPLLMVQVGYGERARHAAQRTFLPGPESGGFGQNDVAAPALIAWPKQETAGESLDACLAVLAVIASQALYVTERRAPPRLAGRLEKIRTCVPPINAVRALGPECGLLAAAFTAEVFDPGATIDP